LTYTFTNASKGTELARTGRIANNPFTRAKGLLGTRSISPGEGLLITQCKSIHMFWMLYAIDVIFVDQHNVVVGLVRNIKPWRMSAIYWQAESCLELPPGVIDTSKTELGDKLTREKN
jgi:uncharacterized membrane protein (UPF0127 family)